MRSFIHLYLNPISSIGVYVPYAEYVEHTFNRIIATLTILSSDNVPVTFQIADELDGSGCHTVYNQQNTNTSTKTFIFCFKAITIKDSLGDELWKHSTPNSPFCQRPVFLCYKRKQS